MKKLLLSVLILMIALAACTAGGTETEETAEPPTKVSLEEAPTATDEPPVPTAEPSASDIPTATPEPEPTETAAPTATEENQPTPQEEVPSGNSGTIPENVQMPEGAVIAFSQTGGFAGLNNNWVFYPDGRVTLNGVDQAPLGPERIDQLISDLAALGFFEVEHKPGTFCCDFFNYSLAVQTAAQQNFVSYSDGNPDLPENLLEITRLMREITEEAQVR